MSDKYDDAMSDQGEIDRRFLQLEGRTLTLDQLKALPPPAPMINDYLFKRTVAWLHGRWGSFKSFVAVDMACCVATGIPWHGHDVAQGNVLYLAAEGSQGLGQRFEAWEKHHRNPDMDRLKVLPMPVQLAEMDGLDVPAIIMLVKQFNTDLLILDTQARVTTGKDENSGRDMSVFTSHLSEIVEATGCTILVIHHEPRRGDNLRGHSSLEGAADTILRTELQSENHDHLAEHQTQRRRANRRHDDEPRQDGRVCDPGPRRPQRETQRARRTGTQGAERTRRIHQRRSNRHRVRGRGSAGHDVAGVVLPSPQQARPETQGQLADEGQQQSLVCHRLGGSRPRCRLGQSHQSQHGLRLGV